MIVRRLLALVLIPCLLSQSVFAAAGLSSTNSRQVTLSSDEAIGFLTFFFSRVSTVGELKELIAVSEQSSTDAQFLKSYLEKLPSSAKLPTLKANGQVIEFIQGNRTDVLDVSQAAQGKFKVNSVWIKLKKTSSFKEIVAAVSKIVPTDVASEGILTRESSLSRRISSLHFLEPAYANPGAGALPLGIVLAFFIALSRGNERLDSIVLAGLFSWFYVLYALMTPVYANAEGASIQNPKCPSDNNGVLEITYGMPSGEKTMSVQFSGENPSKLVEATGSPNRNTKSFVLNSNWAVSSPAPEKADFASNSGMLSAFKQMNELCRHNPKGLAKAIAIMNEHPLGAPAPVQPPSVR